MVVKHVFRTSHQNSKRTGFAAIKKSIAFINVDKIMVYENATR